ncbi:MAG: alpha/beta hydrolase-fold protein [Acidobacteriota bacterium]|nr:alpha/beta hydrolase-fold protein [Acidobacteriota bacterium]
MKRGVMCVAVFCLVAGSAFAGEPITIGETITMPSKIMGEERTILISTPPGYEQSSERYPVLYMTDGDAHLTHTRGTVDFLARSGLMPQVIIVGVTNTDRTRDLTPTRVETREVNGREMQFPTSGGADRFLDFFEDELFPFVEANYRTVSMRLFSGHSFGGLFALNAFFTRPEMFNAVLSISPSLRWDDDLPLRQAQSFFKDRKELHATLFVAMADEERGTPPPTLLDRLEQTLEMNDATGFRFEVLQMPDEDHGSVVLRAQYWGLREVFDGWRLPTNPETRVFSGSLEDLQGHYAKLSNRYGYSVVPSENTFNGLGYQIMGRGDFDGAIDVFRYNATLHPDSANVYDSLGEALENADRLEEALSSFSKAVENGTANGDANLGIFTANRDRVQQLVEKEMAGQS